jgi:hypothetical protein
MSRTALDKSLTYFDHRRLSGAVWPQDGGDLARRGMKRNIINGTNIAISNHEVFYDDTVHRLHTTKQNRFT